MKPETVQKVEGNEIPKTLDNKPITVFDYANKRAGELSSKVIANRDSLKNLKLVPEASQKVSAITDQMDELSEVAKSQIARLEAMRNQSKTEAQPEKSETPVVKMDDGNIAVRENQGATIDTAIKTLNPIEKVLVSKDLPEGAETMEKIIADKTEEPKVEQVETKTSEQIKDERKNQILAELKKEWLGKNGTWEVSMSRSEIEKNKQDAEMRGVEWDGQTTKITDSASNAFFDHEGKGKNSMPSKAEQILAQRFPEYAENKPETKVDSNKSIESVVQKPELSTMTFNDAIKGVETGSFEHAKDDAILEQLINAEKVENIEELGEGDELEMTQMTDVENAGADVGEIMNGKLLGDIRKNESFEIQGEDGEKSFSVKEIYNLDDKYVIETDDGFFSIAKPEQSNPVTFAPETKSTSLNAIRETHKQFAAENNIPEQQTTQSPETAQDAIKDFLKNEKQEEPIVEEKPKSNWMNSFVDERNSLPVNPETSTGNNKSEQEVKPDLPPLPPQMPRVVESAKKEKLSFAETKERTDAKIAEFNKNLTEKKNTFLGKTKKAMNFLSKIPGNAVKYGVAGGTFLLDNASRKLSDAETFVAKKYNNAVESAGRSIDKAQTKAKVFTEGYKKGVNEYRLEKALKKQESLQNKMDKVNERVSSGQEKALQNATNLKNFSTRLQGLKQESQNNLAQKQNV